MTDFFPFARDPIATVRKRASPRTNTAAPVTSRQSFQNRYPHQFSAQQRTEEPHSNLKSVDKHSG